MPDILECKVKWDLGNITMNKVSGADGILCACMLTCFRVSGSLQHYGPWPVRLLCPRHYPGKNIRVGFHSLLQGFFLTLGLDPCLLCLLNWQMGFFLFSPLVPPGKTDGSLAELFKILNDEYASNYATFNMPANLENSAVATGQENVSFPSNPKER